MKNKIQKKFDKMFEDAMGFKCSTTDDKPVVFSSAGRQEHLKMNIRMEKWGYDAFKDEIDSMTNGGTPPLQEGDSFAINYDLYLEYFGSVAKNLETICKMRKAGCQVKIDAKEINHGRCLIAEILGHMDTLI